MVNFVDVTRKVFLQPLRTVRRLPRSDEANPMLTISIEHESKGLQMSATGVKRHAFGVDDRRLTICCRGTCRPCIRFSLCCSCSCTTVAQQYNRMQTSASESRWMSKPKQACPGRRELCDAWQVLVLHNLENLPAGFDKFGLHLSVSRGIGTSATSPERNASDVLSRLHKLILWLSAMQSHCNRGLVLGSENGVRGTQHYRGLHCHTAL